MHTISQGIQSDQFLRFYRSLSHDRKAGFFLWPSLEADEPTLREMEVFCKYVPSGMIFFRRNFSSLSQAQTLISKLRSAFKSAELPCPLEFMTAIDEEGGRVSRLPLPFPRGKAALTFGEEQDTLGLVGQVLHQCFVSKGIGINCMLSPVVDILTEPTNPVMGDRCFGRDADTVSFYGKKVFETLSQQKILSCAKHFPGHGNTLTDSHKGFAVSDVSLETLKSREWKPFSELISAGIPSIMTAHVMIPELDRKFPATLSSKILQEHLRGTLGFGGLIISDDLRMNAVADFYGQRKSVTASVTEDLQHVAEEDTYLRQASIDALKAGCDILLSCSSIVREEKIFEEIANRLKDDKEFEILCEEKALRIFSVLSVEL